MRDMLTAVMVIGCVTWIIPVCIWHIGKGIVEEVIEWLSR